MVEMFYCFFLNNQKNLWLPSIYQFDRKTGLLNLPNLGLAKYEGDELEACDLRVETEII